MKKRKVHVIDPASDSAMILITNAPADKIKGKMDDWDKYVSNLSTNYYTRVLYDSRKDDHDTAGIINYEEGYYVNMTDKEALDYEIKKWASTKPNEPELPDYYYHTLRRRNVQNESR